MCSLQQGGASAWSELVPLVWPAAISALTNGQKRLLPELVQKRPGVC